jgi:hypothetical protein
MFIFSRGTHKQIVLPPQDNAVKANKGEYYDSSGRRGLPRKASGAGRFEGAAVIVP